MDDLFSWDRCDHSGIGKPGCATCDPKPVHVRERLRVVEERLRQAQAERDAARADRDRLVRAVHEAAWPLGLGTMTTAEAIAEMGRLAAQRDAFGEQAEQVREREARLVAAVRRYAVLPQRDADGGDTPESIASFRAMCALADAAPTPTTDAEEA